MTAALAGARSWLFVPGNRPDRFAKALAAGADMVIIDLEDAVPPADKDTARTAVTALLDSRIPGEAITPGVAVRINAADTPWHGADLALAGHPALDAVMLPKARADATLQTLAARIAVVALIETALGLVEAAAVAATPGVARLAFGAIDMALDLDLGSEEGETPGPAGAPPSRAEACVLDPVRLQLAIAARAAGLPAPIDGVTTAVRDAAPTLAAVRRARSLGLTAKLCIHPAQVAWVHAALAPTAAELAWAQRVVAADAAAQGAAVLLDGAMIDAPVVARAHRILRAGA